MVSIAGWRWVLAVAGLTRLLVWGCVLTLFVVGFLVVFGSVGDFGVLVVFDLVFW